MSGKRQLARLHIGLLRIAKSKEFVASDSGDFRSIPDADRVRIFSLFFVSRVALKREMYRHKEKCEFR